jgi:hypothetical protein
MTDQCQVASHGVLYTNFEIQGSGLVIDATVYDDSLTLENLPDKYKLIFVYYVMQRYYTSRNADLAAAYASMHEREMAKLRRRTTAIMNCSLGSDL